MVQDIFKRRVIIAISIVILVFLGIIARSYTLQITEHETYKQQALGNSLTLSPVIPARGRIFDRNGILLADNALMYKLTVIPEKVENIDKALLQLQDEGFITDAQIKRYYKVRKQYKKFQNIPLRSIVTPKEASRFLVTNRPDGIELTPYFYRTYPDGTLHAHITGYIGRMSKEDKQTYKEANYKGTEFVGKIGIEKQYERRLHGIVGTKQIERDVRGRIIDEKVVKPAVGGEDLYLSIDVALQKIAYEAMGKLRGSVVVTDVNTGEILTMVSAPSFDNNLFPLGISSKDYNELNTNKNLPLFNRAIRGTYPPGSTIKPIVSLVGLEEGVITRKHTKFCSGYYTLPNYSRKFNDWNRNGHGTVGVVDAIAESCDIFYYDLARKMGINLLYQGMSDYFLGTPTGIDLPNEEEGILPSKEWKRIYKKEPWYEGETLITGIGQGFMTATPLQLAMSTSVIANFGQKVRPTLLKNTSPQVSQVPIKDIKNWELTIAGMREAIVGPKGTARKLNKGLEYTFAGKTGTSQVFGLDPEEKYIAERYAEHLRDHSLFVGFAPIEQPEIAISVIAENAGSGSAVAAPIAKKVVDAYFSNKRSNEIIAKNE